jgi:hypothetical protein
MKTPSPVILWKTDAITCACLHHAPDQIEVFLVVAGVVIQTEVFSDPDAATKYSLAKMRAYNAV